jgi:hypothetical protein
VERRKFEMIKNLLFMLLISFMVCQAQTVKKVHKPGEILPRCWIVEDSKGNQKIYDNPAMITPKWEVRQGEIYPAGKPVIPVGEVKDSERKSHGR